MTPTLQVLLAMLAFGLPALLATRLRAGFAEKGPAQYVSWHEVSALKSKAARVRVNRLLIRMGWSWVLLCAPLLSYLPGGLFDFRKFMVVFFGCLLLGILVAAAACAQVEKFERMDRDEDAILRDVADRLIDMGRYDEQHLARAVREARASALAEAAAPIGQANRAILWWALVATALIPALNLLAGWASTRTPTGYAVILAVLSILIVAAYGVSTLRT